MIDTFIRVVGCRFEGPVVFRDWEAIPLAPLGRLVQKNPTCSTPLVDEGSLFLDPPFAFRNTASFLSLPSFTFLLLSKCIDVNLLFLLGSLQRSSGLSSAERDMLRFALGSRRLRPFLCSYCINKYPPVRRFENTPSSDSSMTRSLFLGFFAAGAAETEG